MCECEFSFVDQTLADVNLQEDSYVSNELGNNMEDLKKKQKVHDGHSETSLKITGDTSRKVEVKPIILEENQIADNEAENERRRIKKDLMQTENVKSSGSEFEKKHNFTKETPRTGNDVSHEFEKETNSEIFDKKQNVSTDDGWERIIKPNKEVHHHLCSRTKVPGEPQNGDKPSSTLTEREFTKVKKLKISAQKFPCFTMIKQLNKQLQVISDKGI